MSYRSSIKISKLGGSIENMKTEEERIKCFAFEIQIGGYLPQIFSTVYWFQNHSNIKLEEKCNYHNPNWKLDYISNSNCTPSMCSQYICFPKLSLSQTSMYFLGRKHYTNYYSRVTKIEEGPNIETLKHSLYISYNFDVSK